MAAVLSFEFSLKCRYLKHTYLFLFGGKMAGAVSLSEMAAS